MRRLFCFVIAFTFVSFTEFSLAQSVDPKLAAYKFSPGPSGQLKSVGSDTMNNLMLQWTEKFKTYYKGVRTEVEGQGSSKAMPALIEGAASFGPMSRDAKSNEVSEFEKKFGYPPPDGRRFARDLRAPRLSLGVADPRASGFDFFEYSQTGWATDRYVGAIRTDWRI
jgi:phosphate transport system substrate-binding protein